jgi:hypothetical protein
VSRCGASAGECYIRSDLVLGRYLSLLVRIDLGEGDLLRAGQARRELFVNRGDGLARGAPICVDCPSSQLGLRGTVQLASSDAVSQYGQFAGWGLAGGNAQSVTTILEDLKISLNCAEDTTCTVFDIFGKSVCGVAVVLGSGEVVKVICNGTVFLLCSWGNRQELPSPRRLT